MFLITKESEIVFSSHIIIKCSAFPWYPFDKKVISSISYSPKKKLLSFCLVHTLLWANKILLYFKVSKSTFEIQINHILSHNYKKKLQVNNSIWILAPHVLPHVLRSIFVTIQWTNSRSRLWQHLHSKRNIVTELFTDNSDRWFTHKSCIFSISFAKKRKI